MFSYDVRATSIGNQQLRSADTLSNELFLRIHFAKRPSFSENASSKTSLFFFAADYVQERVYEIMKDIYLYTMQRITHKWLLRQKQGGNRDQTRMIFNTMSYREDRLLSFSARG